MTNYKVEKVEIRQRRKGEPFLQVTILNKSVGFFGKDDRDVEVNEGDVISCDITQKGRFYDGTNLNVLDIDPADAELAEELEINQIIEADKYTKQSDDDTKLHAGARIYYFDIKTTSKGDKYLVITEQSGRKKNRIFIFNDHAKEFSERATKFLDML